MKSALWILLEVETTPYQLLLSPRENHRVNLIFALSCISLALIICCCGPPSELIGYYHYLILCIVCDRVYSLLQCAKTTLSPLRPHTAVNRSPFCILTPKTLAFICSYLKCYILNRWTQCCCSLIRRTSTNSHMHRIYTMHTHTASCTCTQSVNKIIALVFCMITLPKNEAKFSRGRYCTILVTVCSRSSCILTSVVVES